VVKEIQKRRVYC